jgi:hypothetical protein
MRTENPTPPPRLGSQMWCPKEDSRPHIGLWAPGEYLCECRACRDYYLGDKRSLFCADCAYKEEARTHEDPPLHR